MKEDEWIRYNCLILALAHTKPMKIKEVLYNAKEMSDYIFSRPSAEIHQFTKGKTNL
jgi:hypothetical protein